ncbi:ArnT family glycosyltransferase [Methylomonas albis]|uniref:Glycosyltransferase family 39 protein n=1 Tax=Methylomonas albis TaxID=1854563 RepID=A0ABR9D1P0_9GAMM|nr:glycosyltransferase family 39 protein [Methylomonas albis]MBD9357048.1 glycosyltransferase family 39 protein [Methylomonas albis]
MKFLSFFQMRGIKKLFSVELFFILFSAISLRLIFFNGPFGTDEITYLVRSLEVTNGEWSSSNYNGALRYGYNIPSGFLIYLFGLNIYTANLWALSCSIIEICAVYYFASKFISHKAAILSSLFLAFTPLHVAVSTRLHADPVVSMFLTLSFVFFYIAERNSNKVMYFFTGILLGCVFWVKELAAIVFFAFIFYPLVFRKLNSDWFYLVFGGLFMLLGHFVLMEFIAGDPFHAIKTVLGQVNRSFISNSQGEDSPWYYFYYLFFDIKHTWLMPLIALLLLVFINKKNQLKCANSLRFCLFWLLSLLVVLSFFPVSFSPIRFAMKQSNYITLFLAPISLIAGTAVSYFSRRTASILIVLFVSGGIALAALEQQAYQVFTANSRGLMEFSVKHPDQYIFGSVNNKRIACFYRLINGNTCLDSKVYEYSQIPEDLRKTVDTHVYTVIDRETLGWGISDVKIEKVPSCWNEVEKIAPSNTGNGIYVLDMLLTVSKYLSTSLTAKLQTMKSPNEAKIYSASLANIWCERN